MSGAILKAGAVAFCSALLFSCGGRAEADGVSDSDPSQGPATPGDATGGQHDPSDPEIPEDSGPGTRPDPPDEEGGGFDWMTRLSRKQLGELLEATFPEAMQVIVDSPLLANPDPQVPSTQLVATEPFLDDMLCSSELVADALVQDEALASLLPCSIQELDTTCVGELVDRTTTRLFERSPSDQEREEYVSLFQMVERESDPQSGIKWLIVAMLQSPHTMYRFEEE